MTTQLQVAHLRKEFPTRAGTLTILEDVNLTASSGESVAVLGPSGSGKSTLLHIIGTLDRPTSGTVRLGDVTPLELSEKETARFRNRSIGFVFQEHYLLPELSVLENVLIPVLASGPVDESDRDRALELIEQVGLADRADHRPGELSGGERGRVAIARALIRQPQLLLADEPTGNLDPRTAATVMELLLDLQSRFQTILIVVTHSLAIAKLLQRRYELIDGRLVESSEAGGNGGASSP